MGCDLVVGDGIMVEIMILVLLRLINQKEYHLLVDKLTMAIMKKIMITKTMTKRLTINNDSKSNNNTDDNDSAHDSSRRTPSNGGRLYDDKKSQTHDECCKQTKELHKKQLAHTQINRIKARIYSLKWKHERELEEDAGHGVDVPKREKLRKSHMSMQTDNEMLNQIH